MNTHDIDTGLPHVAFCRVRDVDPHESHHRQLGVSADTRLYTEDQVITAIEADRKRRGEPVGYRLVRRTSSGDWVTDGRSWCDGAPPADLLTDTEKSGHFRIEYVYGAPQPAEPVKVPSDAAVEAIAFALEADDGMTWLRLWNEGEFDTCRKEWPEAPEEVFIGADPAHPETRALLARYGHSPKES